MQLTQSVLLSLCACVKFKTFFKKSHSLSSCDMIFLNITIFLVEDRDVIPFLGAAAVPAPVFW